MKCVHCAAPIKIEDERCPYCGEVNVYFQKHRADMRRYAADYEETAQKVSSSTRRFTALTVPVIALGVMMIANCLMLFLLFQADSIGYRVRRNNVDKFAGEHRQELIDYLEEGDYISFDAFYSAYSLYSADSVNDLNGVQSCVAYFQDFCNSTHRLESYDDSEYRDELISQMANQVLQIFNVEQNYGRYNAELYLSEDNLRYIHDVQESTKAILISRFHLTEEQVESISDYSESKIASLLAEGLA